MKVLHASYSVIISVELEHDFFARKAPLCKNEMHISFLSYWKLVWETKELP